jgi:ParB family chromosome partitioning protein
MRETWYVSIKDITPDPHNPRKAFTAEELLSLSQSIKTYGLVQPIVLREAVPEDKVETKYVIVAGERRWRACSNLNWEEIPCTMLSEVAVGKKNSKPSLADRNEIPVHATAELALVENIQRQNLTPIEEAHAFAGMLERDSSLNANGLAQRLGLTSEYIRIRLRLRELPAATMDLINAGKLPLQHANILHALVGHAAEAKIDAVAQDASRKRMPAKSLERIVRGMLDKAPRKKFTREDDAHETPSRLVGTVETAPLTVPSPANGEDRWKYIVLPPVTGTYRMQPTTTVTSDKGFCFATSNEALYARVLATVVRMLDDVPNEGGEEWDV